MRFCNVWIWYQILMFCEIFNALNVAKVHKFITCQARCSWTSWEVLSVNLISKLKFELEPSGPILCFKTLFAGLFAETEYQSIIWTFRRVNMNLSKVIKMPIIESVGRSLLTFSTPHCGTQVASWWETQQNHFAVLFPSMMKAKKSIIN